MYEDSQRDMASCEFADGITNVRGTLAKTVVYEHGMRIITRVVAKITPSGKQRIYLQRGYQRSVPVTAKEKMQRERFTLACTAAGSLSEKQVLDYRRQWEDANGCFNGKQYRTLRGYIIARLLDAKNTGE